MRAEIEVNEREWTSAPIAQRRALRAVMKRVRENPRDAGTWLGRELVPKRFDRLANLYRLELRDGWRALYTVIARKDGPPIVRVVFIGNHSRYDRLFGYS